MTMSDSLPVAVDVMGGDFGPEIIVRGAIQACNKLQIKVLLVGDENLIRAEMAKNTIDRPEMVSIFNAPEFITMEDSPTKAIRSKANYSIKQAFQLVKEGQAQSVVSPGNTGAMLAAGLYVVGAIEGISRPAIATLIPRADESHPTVLVDSGANVQCHAEQFAHFAIMGKFYSQALFNLPEPRIGILSNGTESSKGNDLSRASAYILSNIKDLNFIGFVEGRHIPRDIADVVVCDGFVGNIVLKTMEGSVELVVDSIRRNVSESWRGKIGMYLAKPIFKKLFKEKLDPSSYGGAPLLGLNNIAIVCHGSSNEKAIFNAIRVANQLYKAEIISKMTKSLVKIESILDDVSYEDGMWDRASGKFDIKKKKSIVERS